MDHNENEGMIGDEEDTSDSEPKIGADEENFMLRDNLIVFQEKDPSLSEIWDQVVSESEVEVASVCYYKLKGVLMRKWQPLDARPSECWRVVNQIVVPKQYCNKVLHLAHGAPMAGHLGFNKTHQKILQNFY